MLTPLSLFLRQPFLLFGKYLKSYLSTKTVIRNYRTITGPSLCYLSYQKICERVTHNQFTSYLLSRERLTKNQSGNKKWHSTETSVLQTTDAILSAIDEKKLTAIVLLDMSKAVDSISHEILISKLQDVGASYSCLECFRSYLSERR